MKGRVDIRLSQQAVQDLKGFSFLTRRLLPVVIGDQLVAPDFDGLTAISDIGATNALRGEQGPSPPFESDESHWYAMKLTPAYSALVRPYRDESGNPGALVARVLDTGSLGELTGEPIAEPGTVEPAA